MCVCVFSLQRRSATVKHVCDLQWWDLQVWRSERKETSNPRSPSMTRSVQQLVPKNSKTLRPACTSIFLTNKEEVAGKSSFISVRFLWFCSFHLAWKERGDAKNWERRKVKLCSDTASEPAGDRIPLHFVCKRLEVLNHLALLRWRGGGPASEGQEAIETQLVTQPAATQPMKSNHC